MKIYSFDELCRDFEANKPKAFTNIERFITLKWDNKNSSTNNVLIKWLISNNISYINDMGVVWFKYKGLWTYTERSVDNDNITFYIYEA